MLSRKSWGSILAHHRVENIRGGEFDSWFWVTLETSEGEEVSEVRFYIIEEWIYSTVFFHSGGGVRRISFLEVFISRYGAQ
jgi:hypothetical protein